MPEPVAAQRATAANAEVRSVDWLFEPFWPGGRVMARVDRGRVTLTDDIGQPCPPELNEAAEVLGAAVRAEQAVVDGVWTAQPFVATPDPLAAERRRAFVAVDLVALDGEPLYDVPFGERRRLLESVIDEGIQVRLSPAVKLPLGGWLIGWRANGFTHYVAKHVNSRYLPGEPNEDWLKLVIRTETSPGLMGRLVGTRDRIHRIRD
ncbi:MAG: hypothetical protein H0W98_00235 [Chloroflexi bacterium]|nr:hypothetical protein [Chloroflexota bacterium]MBA3739559.1 hypothetical protein [Chloroflexota bacterium]